MLKKIYCFDKCIQKQICEAHMLTHQVVVLPAATKGIPIVLPHAGAITIEAS
jgi:hypothetical protein